MRSEEGRLLPRAKEATRVHSQKIKTKRFSQQDQSAGRSSCRWDLVSYHPASTVTAIGTMSSFDVTYKKVNFEIVPESLVGSWPVEGIRLQLSNYVPAVIMVSSFFVYYLVLIPVLFPMTKPVGDESIARYKRVRSIHNLLLCMYSGVCCVSAAVFLLQNGQLLHWKATLCTPLEGTWLRPLSVTFTLSKLVEWIDTAFIIWLGKSPPGFLHKYHHATTFWLFTIVPNLPGPEKFGMLLNGFVHTLMYSHYWRPWPKKLVPLITVLQILQLSVVTYAWTVTPRLCPQFATAPSDHRLEFLTPYAMVPVFLYLFVVFFVQRFILKKPKSKKFKES